jgi:hypothetical protein
VLLTLLLFVALLAIASLAWIEKVDFQLRRDREEELIHRGVQYSRAVRRYFKQFGRYPARIEDLEQTNNIRFLRKRYKDPITGKDFKLLHMNDVQTSFSPGSASGLPPGNAGSAAQQGPGALNLGPDASGGSGPSSIPGPPQNGEQTGTADTSNSGQDTSPTPGGQQGAGGLTPVNQTGPGNGPTFGGLPIVGVASTSKEKTIREFNKKDHYNQWQFIYDPTTDRGGLLSTPNQPPLQIASQVNTQNGQPGNNGQQGNGQTQGFGFGSTGINNPPSQPPQIPPPPANQQ